MPYNFKGSINVTKDLTATKLDIDNVDIDGNSIISTDTNGSLNLTPNGTGDLTLDGLKWPQADGSAGFVLKTNGSAQLSWVAAGAGDVIGPASATDNAAVRFDQTTGKLLQNSGVIIDDSNNVTGVAALTGTTLNGTTLTTNVTAAQLSLNGITISGAGTDAAVGITLTPKGTGDLTLDGLKWPQADGTAGYVLKTNGSAQLSWVAQTSGDVVGPGSATDNAVARFDLTTGKIIQGSSVIIDDSNNVTGIAALTATTVNGTTLTTNVAAAQLSLNGTTISGAGSNANVSITLTPKAAGDIVLDGLKWPQADGTAGYILKTDGAGQLSWIENKVGDVVGPASATDNAVARYDLTTGKLIQNSGIIIDDSNNITGVVALTGTTLNGTTVTTNVVAAKLSLNGTTLSGDGTDAAVSVSITPKGTGDLVLDGLKWPQADGTAGYVLKTNGSAQLSWVAQTTGDVVGPSSATDNAIARYDQTTGKLIQGSSVIIDDSNNVTGVVALTGTTLNGTTITTNVAAAQLSLNGITISGAGSDSNIGITLTPKGTGDLTLDGLKWPQADGTAGYVLKTNGSAQLSWVALPTGDVVGPASATDNAVARYDLTTGKIIQGSSVIIDDSNNVTGVAALTATTVNGTTLTTNVAASQLSLNGTTISGAGSDTNVSITLTPKAAGDLILDGLKWPQADGTANYVLKTNGSAQLSWVAQNAGDVVGPASATDNALARFDLTTGKLIQNSGIITDDSNNITGIASLTATTANATTITTNVAAAQLSLNGITISGAGSDSNIGITLTPKGTGDLTLDGLKWPQADGTAGYILKTNGSAQLSWIAPPTGDVVGPASATDNAIARYDLTTGKIIQNSGVIIDDSNNVSGLLSLSVKGTASGYADSEEVFKQAGVQTTNNTPTQIAAITLASNTMLTVEARFNGFKSDYSASCGGFLQYTARRAGAGAIEVSEPIVNVMEDSAGSPTVDADVSGNDVRLLVTGITSETWNWVVSYRYHFTKTNA